MSQQDIIREGIAELLKSAGLVSNASFNQALWATDGLLGYLHSQGVVIKVDREFPDTFCECCKHYDPEAKDECNFNDYCGYDFMGWELSPNFVAIAPLIKE